MNEIPLDAWTTEPPTVLESEYTPWASSDWHAWNIWSVEKEVADFLPQLIDTIGAKLVLESGCGQGYVTRRIRGHADIIAFESDDELRERVAALDVWEPGFELSDQATPPVELIAEADLFICDSDVKYRVGEVKRWVEHGKPGSYLFVHDTAQHQGMLPVGVFNAARGLPSWQFDNPRGSTLFYKTTANVEYEDGPQGSVFVAQIDGGEVSGGYTHSMVKAVTYAMQFPGMFAGYLRWAGGPLITKARTEVVKHFLDNTDADWLLQIDSDMTFSHDLIKRLWDSAHPTKRPIVAGHCYALMAERGPTPTMWLSAPEGSPGPLIPFEGYPRDQLVPVGATGSACLMVHRSVFEKMREVMPDHPYPWFEEAYWGTLPVGEDLTFCLRAGKLGYPIFVDTSLDVGHVKPQVVDNHWFAMWRKARRFVITGWPRSGTGHMADLLRRVGVSCGHEWVFTTEGVNWLTRWGDSSWMAVPFLDGFDGHIVQLVRDPMKVAESLVRIGVFDPTFDETRGNRDFREFIYKHTRVNPDDRVEDQVVDFMEEWHTRMTRLPAVARFRIEDLTVDDMIGLVGLTGRPKPLTTSEAEGALSSAPKNTNHRPAVAEAAWGEEHLTVLDNLRVWYGYQEE